jgi:hypothetical protein
MRARLGVALATAALLATGWGHRAAERAAGAPPPAGAAASLDTKTPCAASFNSIRRLSELGHNVGRHFRCASLYNDAAPTWQDWAWPWFLHHPDPDLAWPGWVQQDPRRRRLVIGQSLIPTAGVAGDWRLRGARGEYDRYIRGLARNLVRAGLGHSVIRLAHESNGDWSHDNVGSTGPQFRRWRAYWARFTRVMGSVPGARFTFDWNLNAAYRDLPLRRIYPGDGVVDVIGIDVYDDSGRPLPAAPSPARWSALVSQPGGVQEIVRFARRHGKPISLPEWGLIQGENGGGDNPNFVASIAALVRNNRVAYQSYFESRNFPGVLRIDQTTRSLAVYRAKFRPGGPSAGPGWVNGRR